MPERKDKVQGELDDLREMTDRLEGDLEEEESIDLLTRAVDKAENISKKLEEAE